MVKVGDKVVVVSSSYETPGFIPGDVVTVDSIENEGLGASCRNKNGLTRYFSFEGVGSGYSKVRPYTESEAEKRGAKFGTMGVVKATGCRASFVKEFTSSNIVIWRMFFEDEDLCDFLPSEIRLDHEPEYVAWKDAPEELKYDASRVYCRRKENASVGYQKQSICKTKAGRTISPGSQPAAFRSHRKTMTPSILQTQFLRRYITMEPRSIPVAGPFAGVSVDRSWFNIVDPDIPTLQITKTGIKAFWSGVKKHGAKAVMGKPVTVLPPNNTPPTGGTPAAVAA